MVIHSATPPDVGASPTKEEWVAKNGSAERSSAIRVSGAHLALFEARGFQSQIGPARQEFNKLLTWGGGHVYTNSISLCPCAAGGSACD